MLMKVRDIVKTIDTRNLSAYPMTIPDVQAIVETAEGRLQELNDQYNTQVGLAYLSIGDLEALMPYHENITIHTQGFVDHAEPWNIYMVPVNIIDVSDASEFVEHEYQHVLDLTCEPGTVNCPINIRTDDQLREVRAVQAEEIGQPLHPIPISAKEKTEFEKVFDTEKRQLDNELSTLAQSDPIFRDLLAFLRLKGSGLWSGVFDPAEVSKATGHPQEALILAYEAYMRMVAGFTQRVMDKSKEIGFVARNPQTNWDTMGKLWGELSALLMALTMGINAQTSEGTLNVLHNIGDKVGEMKTEVARGVSSRQISPKNPDYPVGRDAILASMANMAHAEVHLVNILPGLAQKIREKRKELELFMWGDTSDGIIVKDCPFCALKHLLISSVYLWEAPSFGMENIPIEYQEIFEIAKELDTILTSQVEFAQKFLVK